MADDKKKKVGGDKSKMLGLEVTRADNFSEWYTQVTIIAELIEYYDISGCYILRPWSYGIWEAIQQFFDKEIKKIGVQNAYFPLFVSERALTKEKDHIEGFAPEVAWVTKAGQSNLNEPIAVRPTSETIMYPAYAKWIRSHRDLPLKLNQWANVVRWEFKNPTPFLRSREFLWQEGHTVFATQKEAEAEVYQILDLYRDVYEKVLAVPVVKGKKSEKEKFPGGLFTTTVEAFIPHSGRTVQAATSHCLGQNFAKMFGIEFEADDTGKQYAWQNSWGLSTRSIGVMIMVHGDDRGLVVPPRVAPTQVVIVPIFFKNEEENTLLVRSAKQLMNVLVDTNVRAQVDDRTNYNPGWKYNHWEVKGVPIRIELGPKDFANKTVVLVRRDNGQKETVSQDNLKKRVPELLEEIQNSLFEAAKKTRDERIVYVKQWSDFLPSLDAKKLVYAPWCERTSCEDDVKTKTSPKKEEKKEDKNEEFEPISGAAKTLCIPFEQPKLESGTKCFHCGEDAKVWCLWGRSY